MPGYLIRETTKEEREQIVSDALGNISASCDGCMPGLAEMYQEYIDGKKRSGISIWNFRYGMCLERTALYIAKGAADSAKEVYLK